MAEIIMLAVLGLLLALGGRRIGKLWRIVGLVIYTGIWYYLRHPAIHIASTGLWVLVFVLVLEIGLLFSRSQEENGRCAAQSGRAGDGHGGKRRKKRGRKSAEKGTAAAQSSSTVPDTTATADAAVSSDVSAAADLAAEDAGTNASAGDAGIKASASDQQAQDEKAAKEMLDALVLGFSGTWIPDEKQQKALDALEGDGAQAVQFGAGGAGAGNSRGRKKNGTAGYKAAKTKTPGAGEVEIAFSGRYLIILALLVLIPLLSMLICSPLFLSHRYASRIKVQDVDFSEIPAYSYTQTAIIDRSSAQLLGDKVMGQMTDLVSQFAVSSEYAQISYHDSSVRVTPLAYDGLIKYLRNRKSGVPGYIIVNTTTGKTTLKRLDKRMRFVPSAYWNENLYRRIQFQHPFTIFGNPDFEIDEKGRPWYICTTYAYTGIGSIRRVSGCILFDPVTGTSKKYDPDHVPQWVDRVYPAGLIVTELDDHGKYQKGFFNSFIGQTGVTRTSDGYNYLAKDGDIWLYTGMTSASDEDSNIGFVLVNLRTHEAQYTSTPGAGETSAMASAEGEVNNYGYKATFPTLVNVNGAPYYLLSLKDSAGLVKMYCMVDCQDYQQVYTVRAGKDIQSAITSLIRKTGSASSGAGSNTANTQKQTITITEVRQAVIGSATYVYLQGTGVAEETEDAAGTENTAEKTTTAANTAKVNGAEETNSAAEAKTDGTVASEDDVATSTDGAAGTDTPSAPTTPTAGIYVIKVTQNNAARALFLQPGETIEASCTALENGTWQIVRFFTSAQ